MTFAEWYAKTYPPHWENYHAPVMKESARAAWDAAMKAERCTSVPEHVTILRTLSREERKAVRGEFCVQCGGTDPSCRCWSEE